MSNDNKVIKALMNTNHLNLNALIYLVSHWLLIHKIL